MSKFYRRAGVNISAGQAFVKAIAPLAASTSRKGAQAILGGFGGVFDLAQCGFNDPLLVAATDGVGTKLMLAQQAGCWNYIGQDLVAMCVNDLAAQGATPLFFLDYIACGALEAQKLPEIVAGIAHACRESECALIGGETAEMPQLYKKGDFDLAGFAVGAVERQALLPKQNHRPGDIVLGLSSNGVHANGFSLIRQIAARRRITDQRMDELMQPTRIYVKSILKALNEGFDIKSIAHITGGGLIENLPRAITKSEVAIENVAIEIDGASWPLPDIFKFLMREGDIPANDMLNIFNCGIGLCLIVAEKDADAITKNLQQSGEKVHHIGQIVKDRGETIKITGFNP